MMTARLGQLTRQVQGQPKMAFLMGYNFCVIDRMRHLVYITPILKPVDKRPSKILDYYVCLHLIPLGAFLLPVFN